MNDTIEFMQRFQPNVPGPFSLIGEPDIFIEGNLQKNEFVSVLRDFVSEGIKQHPKGERWATWQKT